MSHSVLVGLNLRTCTTGNFIGVEGTRALAAALKVNSTLQLIDLSREWCGFCVRGACVRSVCTISSVG